MKSTVKIISLIMGLLMVLSLTACGGEIHERILYVNCDLEKYVTVDEYEGIKIDTSSDDFKKHYDSRIENDISVNSFYDEFKEGIVNEGDIANIDYTGKKDGVAFDGGTAEKQDLLIGSGTFIEGFEEGLIGKEIGSTVDLNLTFPADYGSQDLAGKDVVFTVKINSVKRGMKTADYYSELGYKSEKEYLEDVKIRAAKNLLLEILFKNVRIKDYPQEDVEIMQPIVMLQIESMYQQQTGSTLQEYLKSVGQTDEDFKKLVLENQIHPTMRKQMPLYYILDKENLDLTVEDVQAQIDLTLAQDGMQDITESQLKEYYGMFYFESLAVEDLVKNYLYDKAVIK